MQTCTKNRNGILFCALGVTEIFLFASPIFGWASIVPVLVKEGYFAHSCEKNVIVNLNSSSNHDDRCVSREKNLNLAFTIACASILLIQFPGGYLADKIKWYKLRFVGSVIFTLSGILWMRSTEELKYVLFGAVSLSSISGFLLYFPLIKLANKMLVKHQSLVMSLFSGAYDSSAVVFFIFKGVHDAGISLRVIFIVYTAMGAVITGCITLYFNHYYANITPPDIIREKLSFVEKTSDEMLDLPQCDVVDTPDGERHLMSEGQEKCLRTTTVDDKSIWQRIFSKPYISQLVYVCITNLRIVSYIGTLNTTLVKRLHCNTRTASRYLNIFGTIQFLGLPLAVLIGPMLDGKFVRQAVVFDARLKEGSVHGLIVTSTVHLFLNTFALIPILEVQVLTFFCHVALRAFLFCSNFSLLARTAPHHHYARLASFILACSNIFSAMQYLLFYWIEEKFDGDPFWVDVGYLIASIILFLHPYKMYKTYVKNTA